jgi:hypothetical protein
MRLAQLEDKKSDQCPLLNHAYVEHPKCSIISELKDIVQRDLTGVETSHKPGFSV